MGGQTDFGKAPRSNFCWVEKFLYPFRNEDCANHHTDNQRGARSVLRVSLENIRMGFANKLPDYMDEVLSNPFQNSVQMLLWAEEKGP